MEDFKNYPLVLFGVTLVGLLLWFLYDVCRELFRFEPPAPPEDLRKVWVEVDPDRFLKNYIHSKTTNYGTAVKTHVFMYKESREVYGTVTPEDTGLWRGQMYNGRQKIFYTDDDAKKWVENYKAHIVK